MLNNHLAPVLYLCLGVSSNSQSTVQKFNIHPLIHWSTDPSIDPSIYSVSLLCIQSCCTSHALYQFKKKAFVCFIFSFQFECHSSIHSLIHLSYYKWMSSSRSMPCHTMWYVLTDFAVSSYPPLVTYDSLILRSVPFRSIIVFHYRRDWMTSFRSVPLHSTPLPFTS